MDKYKIHFPKEDLRQMANRSFLLSLVGAEYLERFEYKQKGKIFDLKRFYDAEDTKTTSKGFGPYGFYSSKSEELFNRFVRKIRGGDIHSHPSISYLGLSVGDVKTALKSNELKLVINCPNWSEIEYFSENYPITSNLDSGITVYSSSIEYAKENKNILPEIFQENVFTIAINEEIDGEPYSKVFGSVSREVKDLEKIHYNPKAVEIEIIEDFKNTFIESLFQSPENYLEGFYPSNSKTELEAISDFPDNFSASEVKIEIPELEILIKD